MERLELFLEPAHARPEDDPAAREHIEGSEHLRRHHGIPVGNDQHASAELDPRGLAREIAHERQRLEIAGCPIPRELPRRRIGIGSALGGGNDHVIGHEDRGVAKLVGLAGELDQDVGNGERAAARKCETEVHGGGHIARPSLACQGKQAAVPKGTCQARRRLTVRISSEFACASNSRSISGLAN